MVRGNKIQDGSEKKAKKSRVGPKKGKKSREVPKKGQNIQGGSIKWTENPGWVWKKREKNPGKSQKIDRKSRVVIFTQHRGFGFFLSSPFSISLWKRIAQSNRNRVQIEFYV